jgi:hypothetical protein
LAAADLSDTATSGNVLRGNGTSFVSAQLGYGDLSGTPTLAATAAATTHNWLNSYTSSTGAFTETQPAAADLSDTATSGNVLRGNGTSFVSAALSVSDLTSGALASGTTATTQASLDKSTKVATTAYVDAAVSTGSPVNASVAASSSLNTGAANYLAGSALSVPSQGVRLGTIFEWNICLTKSSGTTTAITTYIYVGTNGTTSDAAKVTQAFASPASTPGPGRVRITAVVQGTLGSNATANWMIQALDGQNDTILGTGSALFQGTFTFDSTVGSLIFGIAVNPNTNTIVCQFAEGQIRNV